MRTDLSDQQVRQYQDQGFLHVPDFLDASEVDELKQAVLDTIAGMGRRKIAGRGAELEEGGGFYDRVFTQRLNLWRINDTIRRYVINPKLGETLCKLENINAFRVWHDQTLIKEPFANATALHLDDPYWSFYSRHAISIWIALEDATPVNGCLCFLPGTHKMATFENVTIGENFNALLEVYPEMASIDPVPAPMKAGDCSFHNGLTAHGAGVNMTRGRRIAMTCAYMPDGSTFNGQQNVLPDDYVEGLKISDVLNNDELNPIV